MNSSHKMNISTTTIHKVINHSCEEQIDVVAVEEPLEIVIISGERNERERESIAVTMRTPGDDFNLVAGFLFTEGIIKKSKDILSVRHCVKNKQKNIILVNLKESVILSSLNKRNFYMTSSCGICGKTSIEAIKIDMPVNNNSSLQIHSDFVHQMPALFSVAQKSFSYTGGMHAVGLFKNETIVAMKEDIGRHNAFDKAIGSVLSNTPLSKYIGMLSGRISFELVQKAAISGIPILVAIGAPSSLAIELAKEMEITLLGFVRNNRFNIYSGHEKIIR